MRFVFFQIKSPIKCIFEYIVPKPQAKKMTVVPGSHQRCSVRKNVLKNFAEFTGKHLC